MSKTKKAKKELEAMLKEIANQPPPPKPISDLWKKIKFKDKKGNVHNAYLYHIEGHEYYVSQNKGFDTFCHAQTWIINKNQVVE